jgi:hypothetical protein
MTLPIALIIAVAVGIVFYGLHTWLTTNDY